MNSYREEAEMQGVLLVAGLFLAVLVLYWLAARVAGLVWEVMRGR